MFQPLDGPSTQATLSITAAAATELKTGASPLTERKVITVQPRSAALYVYFAAEGVTPSAATVIADGFFQAKNQINTYEASQSQKVFAVSASGTNSVKVAERA